MCLRVCVYVCVCECVCVCVCVCVKHTKLTSVIKLSASLLVGNGFVSQYLLLPRGWFFQMLGR